MPFDKVETQVDFPAQERAILEFWDEASVDRQVVGSSPLEIHARPLSPTHGAQGGLEASAGAPCDS